MSIAAWLLSLSLLAQAGPNPVDGARLPWTAEFRHPGPEHPATLSEAERRGVQFMAANHQRSVAALRRLRAEELLTLSVPASTTSFRPIVDGYVVPYGFTSANALPAQIAAATICWA